MSYVFGIVIGMSASFLVISSVSAQTAVPPVDTAPPISIPALASSEPVTGPDVVGCFDYYRFGSVQADPSADVAATVTGVSLPLTLRVKNANEYPVVDGAVYVKIFRTQSDASLQHQNGDFLVDQFFAAENIHLKAQETKTLSFDWQVPAWLPSGDYRIATFFVSHKQFNLLGLSFTDDVVGNTFDFKVTGEREQAVDFDKNKVTLNGEAYRFAAFPPQFPKDQPVTVAVPLRNPTDLAQSIELAWNLFAWDGLRDENRRGHKTETITLAPGETRMLSYTVAPTTDPVSYLVVEGLWHDAKSILDIRFVREGHDRARLNFPAVTSYPLQAGQPTTLFSCLHNSGVSERIDNASLTLTVTDDLTGQTLHTKEYQGPVSGAMMAIKSDFTPVRATDRFTLEAVLKTDGRVVDQARMRYDCEALGTECLPRPVSPVSPAPDASSDSKPEILVAIIGAGALIALVLVLLRRRRARLTHTISQRHRNQKHRITPYLFLAVISGCFLMAQSVEAKSVTWNKTVSDDFARVQGSLWFLTLKNPHFSLLYSATVVNQTTGKTLSDGNIVSIGNILNFIPKGFSNTDISWFGTGYYTDSPFGHWRANASGPSVACDANDFVGAYSFKNALGTLTNVQKLYIPFSVHPPAVSVSHSGTAVLQCTSPAKTICTVVSPGSIQSQVVFDDTYGKLYYRAKNEIQDNGKVVITVPCEGTNTAIRTCNSSSPDPLLSAQSLCSVPGSDYTLNVPQQTIPFTFTAVAPASNNRPPTPPVITGPITGSIGIAYTFTFKATDPDKDTVQYEVDWDKNGTVDRWLPSGVAFVPSGTPQSSARTWTILGPKTFQARTRDDSGSANALSSWSSHTITLSTFSPSCTPDSTCGGTAASTCVGQQCVDRCGNTWPGIKSCPPPCTPDSTCGGTAASTCVGQQCVDRCGNTWPGTKSCPIPYQEIPPSF